jgi:hypothetical protein
VNRTNLRPFVSVRTIWSDDSETISDPVEEWFGQWIMLTYGDDDMWTGQIRPVRASLINHHLFAVEEIPNH